MNLILIEPDELPDGGVGAGGRVVLRGRRAAHVRDVHRAALGDELVVGRVDGAVGRGRVVRWEEAAVELDVTLEREPPAKLPLTLVLALPRPRVLKRCLAAAAALGAERVVLVNAWRVEKSYWQTPVLTAARDFLMLGLEQARDTRLPALEVRKLFKPFAEDELPAICAGRRALVAHPAPEAPHVDTACASPAPPTVLCVGPEGGWLPYEVEKLERAGARCVQMGPRIQRVEVALAALVGKLF